MNTLENYDDDEPIFISPQELEVLKAERDAAKRQHHRQWGEPPPIPNDHPDIQSAVIADLESRRELGIVKYGTALQPHNGRNALKDAYEEVLDLACYLKQLLVEQESS